MSDSLGEKPTSSNPSGFGATFGNVLEVTVHGAQAHFYTVSEEHLDSLTSGQWVIYTNLASAFFGSFVSLASIFLTGFSNPSPLHGTIASGATMSTGLLCVVFTTLAVIGYKSHTRNLRRLKERRWQV